MHVHEIIRYIWYIVLEPFSDNTRGVLELVQSAFLLGNLRLHLNQNTRIIKYSLLPTIIIENQRSFPVQLCNMGLASVVP